MQYLFIICIHASFWKSLDFVWFGKVKSDILLESWLVYLYIEPRIYCNLYSEAYRRGSSSAFLNQNNIAWEQYRLHLQLFKCKLDIVIAEGSFKLSCIDVKCRALLSYIVQIESFSTLFHMKSENSRRKVERSTFYAHNGNPIQFYAREMRLHWIVIWHCSLA